MLGLKLIHVSKSLSPPGVVDVDESHYRLHLWNLVKPGSGNGWLPDRLGMDK